MAVNLSWATITLLEAGSVRGVAYGNGVYVAVMYNKGYCYTSADRITWTQRTLPTTRTWTAVAFGNGVFVAIPTTGQPAMCAVSADGVNWTEYQISAFGFGNGAAIVFGNGSFVVSGGSNGKSVNTSTDGVTWTAGTATTTHNLWGFTWSGEKFVACGPSTADESAASVSDDGINFTSYLSGATDFRGSVLALGSIIVLPPSLDGGTHVYVSPDNGVSWAAHALPVAGNYQVGGIVGGEFIIANSGLDHVLVSPDGVSWTEYAAPGPLAFRTFASANGASFYVDDLDLTKMYIAFDAVPFWTDLINCGEYEE